MASEATVSRGIALPTGRGELGQAGVEYVGLLVLVALMITALAGTGMVDALAQRVGHALRSSTTEGLARTTPGVPKKPPASPRALRSARIVRGAPATDATPASISTRRLTGAPLARTASRWRCRKLWRAVVCWPTRLGRTARPVSARPFAYQRDRVIRGLLRRATPSTTATARGRDIAVAEPRISAYETFFSLARGPGVQRVSKGPNHWVIRTPEGKIVRLRNPKASSTRDWTVDVVLPDGREWHFKFKPSGA